MYKLLNLYHSHFLIKKIIANRFINKSLCTTSWNSQLSFEKNHMSALADAGTVCRLGDTLVHSVVTYDFNASNDTFLPLTVDYRKRNYAYGVIPDTRNFREKHNSDEEILIARVIDRSIRPLFEKGFKDNVQITVTLHAHDNNNDPLIASVNATSLALMKSSLPWNGPIGCVRVGLIDNKFIINPTTDELRGSKLDLVYAGTTQRTVM